MEEERLFEMSVMIYFWGNFFFIRGEGTYGKFKSWNQKVPWQLGKEKQTGRAVKGRGGAVNTKRERGRNRRSYTTEGGRKKKGERQGLEKKNTGAGKRAWGLVRNRHTRNSHWMDNNPIQNWATEHVFEKGKVYSSPNWNSNFQNSLKGIFPGVYRNQMTLSKKVWVFAVLEKGKLISAESKACTWKEEKFTIKRMFRRKMGRIWYKECLWVC